MNSLRVISYNMHKGFTIGNRRFVLSEMKQAITDTGADLVFLQEVLGAHTDHSTPGFASGAQFEYLADQMWPHYAYGKNAIYTKGHHGNAILSKYPITHWSNLGLSTNQFEQRGMLHAKVELLPERRVIHCFTLHLSLFGMGREKQLHAIAERIESLLDPQSLIIIAGDFNDWRRRASQILEKRLNVHEIFRKGTGNYIPTFPALFPLLALDRIYLRGFEAVTCETLSGNPWRSLSDHRPLLATLTLS